jgi:hypothetical protein
MPVAAPPFISGQSDHETTFSTSSSWKRRTDELSFATDQVPFQTLSLDDMGSEAVESFSPVSVAVEEAGHDFTLNAPGVGVPSRFANAQEMMLDFDRSVQTEAHADYEEVAFNVDSRDPLDVDASGLRVEAASEFQITEPLNVEAQNLEHHDLEHQNLEPHNLETTMLEMPAGYADDDPIDTNPLEMPASSDASSVLANHESAQVDPASLLAIDEPLGDVLIDEGGREIFPPEPARPLDQPLDHTLSGEAFSLEFTPHEFDEPAAATGKMTAITTTDLETPASETESAPGQMTAAETAANDWQPAASNEVAAHEAAGPDSFEIISAQVEESAQGGSIQAGSMGEARTDELGSASASESAEQVEPSAEPDNNDQIDERAINSTFGAYSMWSDEETRFAPIDIEATPLDEPASARVDNEASPLERGFEFTPVASEESTRPNVMPAQEPPAAASPAASDSANQAIELSPALIDDIVRRVIAQMSDAAVREIAWEVVPDCVERVIKEMTKHELTKRA